MRINNSTPVANRKNLPSTIFGNCCECGKHIAIRNSDGMMRKHLNATSGVLCRGAFMAPSKAAASEYKSDWKPARRSN